MVQDALRQVTAVRWRPGRDLLVVLGSYMLVVALLFTATFVVGSDAWGGMAYFLFYAVLGACLAGVGIPVYWMVIVRRRPLTDLGITTRWLGLSILLQIVFAAVQFVATRDTLQWPGLEQALPLMALSLSIGFFEALFWRGWVLMRLEEAFGLLPAILVGSLLYAAYHVGYGMPVSEMAFLFFIAIMFAIVFRITRSVFILWPLFQPMGQLVTLFKDGLELPVLATLGFVEVLGLMALLIWLAARHATRRAAKAASLAARGPA